MRKRGDKPMREAECRCSVLIVCGAHGCSVSIGDKSRERCPVHRKSATGTEGRDDG